MTTYTSSPQQQLVRPIERPIPLLAKESTIHGLVYSFANNLISDIVMHKEILMFNNFMHHLELWIES